MTTKKNFFNAFALLFFLIETIRIHQSSFDTWFDQKCHDAKRLKRKFECRYTKNKCKVDLEAWVNQKQIYRRLCRQKKKVLECKTHGSQKQIIKHLEVH